MDGRVPFIELYFSSTAKRSIEFMLYLDFFEFSSNGVRSTKTYENGERKFSCFFNLSFI